MLIDALRRARLMPIPPMSARSLAASVLVSTLVIATAACAPTYDWRTISSTASGYSVDLPAKPGSDARSVDVDGTPMRMHMQTAEVGGAVFVVGTLDLPDATPATQQKALTFLRDGLARNVGAQPQARAVAVPVATGGSVAGFDMALSGKAGENEESRTIHARLVAKGAHVYQLAIVGREQPAVEQVDQFFQSFKLY